MADAACRPLRIAMLTHSVNPRGGVVHAIELSEALQRQGHAVTLLAPALEGQSMFRPVDCKVELALVPEAARRAPLVDSVRWRIDAMRRHLQGLLQERFFDVFHAQDSITGNALADLRDAGAIPAYVRTVHHLDDFEDAQLAFWQRRAYERAARVLCVSQHWCDLMRIRHGIDTALVHNGVNLHRYGPAAGSSDDAVAARYGLEPGAPVVMAVGGIEERKNAVRLLQAFVLLRRQHRRAHLVMVGGASLLDHDDYGRQWRRVMDDEPGLKEAVRVTGPVDDAAMPALYRVADVLAMPSLREGFGLAALEALASGTPVVVSRIAPFTEFLGDDDVSFADPLSVPSIAAAIERALSQREATPHIDSAALFDRFNWPSSAARHAAIYRRSHATASAAHH